MVYEYEISYITDPQLNDEARGELDAAIDAEITGKKGTIAQASPSLRRRLMYNIDKKMVGFLRTLQVHLDPAAINDIRDILKKKAGVMRVMILNTPQRAEVARDIFTKALATKTEEKAKEEQKPAKKVTMEDVEAGIEEALTEEVK